MTDSNGHYSECSIYDRVDADGDFELDGDGQRIEVYSQCCSYAADSSEYLDGGTMCRENAVGWFGAFA